MKHITLIIFFLSVFIFPVFSQGSGNIISLDKDEFLKTVYDYEKNPNQWVYEGSKPCIVDFYADWCGPCKKMVPILNELAKEYKDQIIIYKVDTDKERELTKAFGISSIPTIMFIPVGSEPQISRGMLSKEELERAIENILLKN